jgi:hypothetical protein
MKAAIASLALAALLIAGCSGKPLPPERLDYAGEWQADTVLLVISPAGEVHYRRQDGGTKVNIDAPIKEFQGDNFLVGVGPFTTTFVVAKRPHLVDGQWRMTVDGRELTRTRAFGGQEA